MKVQLNRAHFPVTTLGPGRRIGLWLQGCHVGCPGCIARDTWGADESRSIEVRAVLDWCRDAAPGGCDGVTISGGEPFEQPRALAALLAGLRAWREEPAVQAFDILCYSGFGAEKLRREHAAILAQLDALIPEPYVDRLPLGAPWRGSANQPLLALSARGRERYARWVDARPGGKAPLQVSVQGGRVMYIGIPDRRDMQRLENAVRQRGVALRRVSWRA